MSLEENTKKFIERHLGAVMWNHVKQEDGMYWTLMRGLYAGRGGARNSGHLEIVYPGDDGFMPNPERNCKRRYVMEAHFIVSDSGEVTITKVLASTRAKVRVDGWRSWLERKIG